MAKQVKLIAERRTATGRSAVRKLKAAGSVPAVVYGSKDKPEALYEEVIWVLINSSEFRFNH